MLTNSKWILALNQPQTFLFFSFFLSHFICLFFFLRCCVFFFSFVKKKIKFQHSIHAFHTHYYEATDTNTDDRLYRIWKCKYLFRQQMPFHFHIQKEKPFSFSSNISIHMLFFGCVRWDSICYLHSVSSNYEIYTYIECTMYDEVITFHFVETATTS